MKVNVVSFSSSGGAGNVSMALAEGFLSLGFLTKLQIATHTNLRSNPLLYPKHTMYAAVDNFVAKRKDWSSLISLSRDKLSIPFDAQGADLNVFRWMNGMLGESMSQRSIAIPNLVWGLDDMNPFTGVCHYSGACRGFECSCEGCPALRGFANHKAQIHLQEKIQFARAYSPRYVAPTEWMHSEFRKSALSREASSHKIWNPIRSKFFEAHESKSEGRNMLRVLVIAQNLDDEVKGVWDVHSVLLRLQGNPRVRLTLVGRFSNQLAAALPKATFLGPVSSAVVLEQLNDNDVLLVPSLFENAGTVIAEAASQGLPSIARRVGGLPEMTNYGRTGVLFSHSDELLDIIESLTKNDLKTLGDAAKEWSMKLQPHIIAKRYAEVFLK